MATITCGKCRQTHTSVAVVKACFAGAEIAPCAWLVERVVGGYYVEYDGQDDWIEAYTSVEDCGAEAIYTDRGFECAAGHAHVTAEVRWQEGWDYAEDAEEAKRLSRAGTEPRDFATGGAFRY